MEASKDNTIFSEGNLSSGSGDFLFAGKIRTGATRRALIAFDVQNAIPAGATIDAVTVRLNANRSNGSTSNALHRLTHDWGEGASDSGNPGGQGTSAATGDATWTSAFFNTVSWNSGGQFVSQASATTSAGSGLISWTSDMLKADVQAWLDGTEENFGWIVIVDESANQTAKRFSSRESNSAASRPRVTIDYTLPKMDQTIAFDAPEDQVLSAGSIDLVATATSGLPVSFEVVSGPATVEGNTLTFTGAGSVTVRASQGGDETYNAAPDVDQTFTINKDDQTITFEAIADQPLEKGSLTLEATASSGLPVSFEIITGPATVEGDVVTFSDLGLVSVRASQAGNDEFNAAEMVEQTFEIKPAISIWLSGNFTESELMDDSVSGDEADPDRDKLVNLVEYGLGLDPRIPSSLFTGNSSLVADASLGQLLLTLSRNLNALDVTITIEFSSDLEVWTAVASSENGGAFQALEEGYMVSETDENGEVTTVDLIYAFSSPAGGFFRIVVSR